LFLRRRPVIWIDVGFALYPSLKKKITALEDEHSKSLLPKDEIA